MFGGPCRIVSKMLRVGCCGCGVFFWGCFMPYLPFARKGIGQGVDVMICMISASDIFKRLTLGRVFFWPGPNLGVGVLSSCRVVDSWVACLSKASGRFFFHIELYILSWLSHGFPPGYAVLFWLLCSPGGSGLGIRYWLGGPPHEDDVSRMLKCADFCIRRRITISSAAYPFTHGLSPKLCQHSFLSFVVS